MPDFDIRLRARAAGDDREGAKAQGRLTATVPLPAAAIEFPFAHPAVAQVLTGARSGSEITDNARLMQTPIPPELWRELRETALVHPKAPFPA